MSPLLDHHTPAHNSTARSPRATIVCTPAYTPTPTNTSTHDSPQYGLILHRDKPIRSTAKQAHTRRPGTHLCSHQIAIRTERPSKTNPIFIISSQSTTRFRRRNLATWSAPKCRTNPILPFRQSPRGPSCWKNAERTQFCHYDSTPEGNSAGPPASTEDLVCRVHAMGQTKFSSGFRASGEGRCFVDIQQVLCVIVRNRPLAPGCGATENPPTQPTRTDRPRLPRLGSADGASPPVPPSGTPGSTTIEDRPVSSAGKHRPRPLRRADHSGRGVHEG